MKQRRQIFSRMRREGQLRAAWPALCSLLIGLLMLLMPHTSRRLLCALAGVGMTAAGLLGVAACTADKNRPPFSMQMALSVCAAAFGVYALLQPAFLLDFFFTVLGVGLLLCGGASLRHSLRLRAYAHPRWRVSLAASACMLLLSATLIFFPGLYGNLLMRVAGLLLIVQSAGYLALSFWLHACRAQDTPP